LDQFGIKSPVAGIVDVLEHETIYNTDSSSAGFLLAEKEVHSHMGPKVSLPPVGWTTILAALEELSARG
jgi:hypothetical protein